MIATGDNVQVYQFDFVLNANTRYVVSFAAYSNTGHDLDLSVAKHSSPYTNYGMNAVRFDLGTTWKTYTTEFTTSNFTSQVNDARLRIWFASYAAVGDEYYIDNVTIMPASALPVAPVLLSPPAGASGQPIDLTLKWQRRAEASSYDIQVALDNGFAAIVLTDTALTDTTYRLSSLEYSTIYYWHVRSHGAAGTGAFDIARSFSTAAAAPFAPPAPPARLVQASGPKETSVIISWPPVNGAVLYHLQLSTDSLFGFLAVNDSSISDTTRTVTSLDPSTRYFARVRSKGAGGMGAFSPVFSFATANTPTVSDLPHEFYLEQNYPNPFNPTDSSQITGGGVSNVKIVMYDLLGREVAVLVNEQKAPGIYEVTFPPKADPPRECKRTLHRHVHLPADSRFLHPDTDDGDLLK